MTDPQPEPRPTPPTPEPPDRLHRSPDEGPAPDGGSGIDADDAAAEEEVGGG